MEGLSPLAFSSPRRRSPEAGQRRRGVAGRRRARRRGGFTTFQSLGVLFQEAGNRRAPTARAASRLRALRSMRPYWFFRALGTHARGGMGQCCRPSSSGRRGALDGLPHGCIDARVACAGALARACPMSHPALHRLQHSVVRLAECPCGQSVWAQSVRDDRSRPSMRTAVGRARGGPPACPASEASRGPFSACERRGQERSFSAFRVPHI